MNQIYHKRRGKKMKPHLPFLKQTPFQKQTQHLMALPQMQQAFQLMQLPILELAALVEYHLEQNPIIAEGEIEPNEEEIENEEDQEDIDEAIEKDLTFEENDFTTLKELEEDFKDYLSDWGHQAKIEQETLNKNAIEQTLPDVPTLFQHLMRQAHETFNTNEELTIAEAIIGNLSPEGYFNLPLAEIEKESHASLDKISEVLKKIQNFEPFGIAASSLQESLLMQLQGLKKEKTIAASILRDHFDDLVHNRMLIIQKKLNRSHEEINNAIQSDIAHLDFHPGAGYNNSYAQPIVPDATLYEEEGELHVRINDDYLPAIHINKHYLQMMQDSSETAEVKEFLHHKLTSAKWLMRNIFQRNETLKKLISVLAKKQRDFFLNSNGKLVPMTMKFLADELDLHESTITRAVVNKYLACPRGLLSLKTFFSVAYLTEGGDNVSSHTIRETLLKLIHGEDSKRPFSDAKLSLLLQKEGIICARRTVAKYRLAMKLGNAQQRKKY